MLFHVLIVFLEPALPVVSWNRVSATISKVVSKYVTKFIWPPLELYTSLLNRLKSIRFGNNFNTSNELNSVSNSSGTKSLNTGLSKSGPVDDHIISSKKLF